MLEKFEDTKYCVARLFVKKYHPALYIFLIISRNYRTRLHFSFTGYFNVCPHIANTTAVTVTLFGFFTAGANVKIL